MLDARFFGDKTEVLWGKDQTHAKDASFSGEKDQDHAKKMPVYWQKRPKPMLPVFLAKNFEEDNPHDQND